jgi:hypothetical protein
VFLVQCTVVTNSISFFVSAQDPEPPEEGSKPPITQPLRLGGYYAGLAYATLVQIIQFVTSTGAAVPPYIEIGYNETITIDVGLMDLNTSEFELVKRQLPILNARYLNFQVTSYPGGESYNSWFITFDPNTIIYDVGQLMKTKATISLTSPPVAENAIQSGVLTIQVEDTWVHGNMWWPSPTNENFQTFISKIFWFLGAVTTYGKYSGTVNTELFNINILVKVKPYHAINFEALSLQRFTPDQIASIPITIQNIGNYNDTFSFRIAQESGSIELANPVSITLAPGETKETYLGISIPPSVFDTGTLHDVKIEAYSLFQPNVTIATRTVYIETRGVYIPETAGVGIGFVGLVIILILGFLFYIQRRREFDVLKKPDKPWNIPEEYAYLETLKEKNKQEYINTFERMKEEYQSSLLWYKDQRKKLAKKTHEQHSKGQKDEKQHRSGHRRGESKS